MCLHPDHAHLEQHAALPREGQEVGHRVAHVLEEGCCDCRLCHAGHQLGKQERSVRPQTHSQPDAKDWTTARGQALWDPADPPAGTAPVSRSPGKPSHPAGASPTAGCWTAAVPCREDTVPAHLRPPATHKAVSSVQSPGHEAHGPWGDPPHLSTKSSGAPYHWLTQGRTKTLSRVRKSSPRTDSQEQLYSMSEPRAGHLPQSPQR